MSGDDAPKTYLPGEIDGDLRHEDGPDADSALIEAELSYISKKKDERASHIADLLEKLRSGGSNGDGPYLCGLALSGGGIRSATFSLGVLQRLARLRERF